MTRAGDELDLGRVADAARAFLAAYDHHPSDDAQHYSPYLRDLLGALCDTPYLRGLLNTLTTTDDT